MTTINSHWYEMPESWVDAIDIEEMGKGAIALLQDMIVSRPVEFGRFKKLFYRAMTNHITLLPRQRTVLNLAEEAKRLGLTETTYISDKLGINRFSAYKALRRAEDRLIVMNYQNESKMETYDMSSSIYTEQPAIKLSDSKTNTIAASLKFDCPTQPDNPKYCTGTASGQYGICYACSEKYGKNKADRHTKGYGWVNEIVAMARKEAVNDAKHQQLNSAGFLNIDVSEVA